MKTEPWARRMLNTQLASWAELRHDTLLYAKQSYTGFPVCEFPDAYVDPYPEAWAGIVRLARLGQTIATALPAGLVGNRHRPRPVLRGGRDRRRHARRDGARRSAPASPSPPSSWPSSTRPSTR